MVNYDIALAYAKDNEELFSYKQIEFPILWDGKNDNRFISLNGENFSLSEEGAGFFAERNRAYPWKHFVELYRKERWGTLASLINVAIAGTKNPRQKFTGVEYAGEIIAVLKYFTRITDAEILETLPGWMKEQIHECRFSKTRSYFNILVEELVSSGYQKGYVFLRISNGTAGVYGMGCELVVQLNNFQYTKRIDNAVRHYKKVLTPKDFPDFQRIFQEIQELEIQYHLAQMTADEFLSLLNHYNPAPNVRQKRLMDLVKNSSISGGLEGFVLTAQFGSSSGYTKATNGILYPIVSHLVEKKTV